MLFVFLKYTLIHIPEIINNKKKQAYRLQQSKSLDETQQYFKSLLQAFVVVKRLQENGIFNFFFPSARIGMIQTVVMCDCLFWFGPFSLC